jgi:hypothetical protein
MATRGPDTEASSDGGATVCVLEPLAETVPDGVHPVLEKTVGVAGSVRRDS